MTAPPNPAQAASTARTHKCAACGIVGPWTTDWAYRTNVPSEPYMNPAVLDVACSAKCMARLAAKEKAA